MKNLRKTKNIYDGAITYENLFEVWKTVKKTCKNKKALFYFELNLNSNLDYIYYLLKNKLYVPDKYRTFMIFEPKPRLVMSQTIKDKIINHFIANYYLLPYLEKSLIDSNVATRKNKGSKYAMNLLRKYYNKILINEKNKEIYCLKIDISKYFYSIDHKILLDKLSKKIKDQNIINIIEKIISETNQEYINNSIKNYNKKYNVEIPYYINNKGLSIGAMTSQFFAIYYLNDLDHYIKEELKNKYYIRYMDDFLILSTDKNKLIHDLKLINKQIKELELKINKKSNIYKSSIGFSFLGYKYKITNNKLRVTFNKATYYKIKRRLEKLYKIDKFKYSKSCASYYGYMKIIKNLKEVDFKMKTIDKYNTYKEKYPNSIVIIKEGIFYKSFYDDAKILWNLFGYKYIKDSTSFGSTPYDKVIEKLNNNDISFVIIDNEQEALISQKDDEIYSSYKTIAVKAFNKETRKIEIINKFKKYIDNATVSMYDDIERNIDNYFKSLE